MPKKRSETTCRRAQTSQRGQWTQVFSRRKSQ